MIDAGLTEEVPFLVMEYVSGLPLRAWLDGIVGEEPLTEDTSVPSVSADEDLPAWVAGDGRRHLVAALL